MALLFAGNNTGELVVVVVLGAMVFGGGVPGIAAAAEFAVLGLTLIKVTVLSLIFFC